MVFTFESVPIQLSLDIRCAWELCWQAGCHYYSTDVRCALSDNCVVVFGVDSDVAKSSEHIAVCLKYGRAADSVVGDHGWVSASCDDL